MKAVSEINCHCPKGSRHSYTRPGATGQRSSLHFGSPSCSLLGTPTERATRKATRGRPGAWLDDWSLVAMDTAGRAGAEPNWIREGSGESHPSATLPLRIPTPSPPILSPHPQASVSPVFKRQRWGRNEKQKGKLFSAAFFAF